jgi:hypothetical protein
MPMLGGEKMTPARAQRQEELLSGGERGQVSTFDRMNFFDT